MICAVIVAAGKGTRMGPDVDKLFLEVGGRPIVAHTWARFDAHPSIQHIVLVVREGMQGAFAELARGLNLKKPFTFALGGRERQDSVWNGLQALPEGAAIVAIQDGARPCTSLETISETITAAAQAGAAVAAQKVTDTIKEAGAGSMIARNVDRTLLWSVQTPQAFRVEVIRKALGEVISRRLPVTDDTAACELIGQPVRLVESRSPNPKITTPGDLPLIGLLLNQMA